MIYISVAALIAGKLLQRVTKMACPPAFLFSKPRFCQKADIGDMENACYNPNFPAEFSRNKLPSRM